MRLLLAEDDASLAELLREFLTEERFRIAHAPTREAALRLAAGGAWDLIVTDTFGVGVDPDPTDLAYLGELAARAPVVLLTAQTWARTVSPADVGVRAIVPKPFDLERLLDTLRAT
jgi:DNA-binding response OmpR family regulator